jgi:hypothetical protein
MRIDSSELYYAQQLANLYKSNSTSSSSSYSTDTSTSALTSSSSTSLVDYLSSSDDDIKSLSSIQFEMMNSSLGQMQRFRSEGNEEMEAFKESADAITDSDEDLTSDEMLELLSNLQASISEMSPEISGLTADTDLESLSEDEISSLFSDVQSSLETLKESGPPPMPPQFGAMMDAYGSSDDDTTFSVETWLEKLQASLDDSEVYSASDLSEILQGIVTDL